MLVLLIIVWNPSLTSLGNFKSRHTTKLPCFLQSNSNKTNKHKKDQRVVLRPLHRIASVLYVNHKGQSLASTCNSRTSVNSQSFNIIIYNMSTRQKQTTKLFNWWVVKGITYCFKLHVPDFKSLPLARHDGKKRFRCHILSCKTNYNNRKHIKWTLLLRDY